MHPTLFYRPGDRLSLSELCAARLDGDVIEIGEGYMPMDAIESSQARAVSIAALIPDRTAASGPTAAWVHGARDQAPSIHHITRISRTRFRPVLAQRVVYHERLLAAEDLQRIAGLTVTTPLATAVGLAFDAAHRHVHEEWLRALLLLSPGLAEQALAGIEMLVRTPGIHASRRLLRQIIRTS